MKGRALPNPWAEDNAADDVRGGSSGPSNPWEEDNARDEQAAPTGEPDIIEAAQEKASPTATSTPVPAGYATSVATTPTQARQAEKQAFKTDMENDLFRSSAKAATYGAARGMTLGAVDRLAGIGTAIGEAAGSTPQTPAAPNAYQQGRREYLDAEDAARAAGAPGSYLGGEVVGGIVPSIAAAPLRLTRFAQSALLGGTSGALNTRSDEPGDIAKGAGLGAAVGLAGEATAGTAMQRLIRRAPTRQENAIIRDVMESEAGRATATTGAKLARDIRDVRDVLRNNDEVAEAVRLPADEARPVVRQHIQVARAGQDQRYDAVDRALARDPLTVTQLLSRIVDAEAGVSDTELPLVKRALLALRDSVREDFAPRWAGTATWNGERVPITAAQLRGWVTSAQSTAERAMGGINGTNAFKVPSRVAEIANQILEDRLDAAAGRGARAAVEGIRESDRVTSALLNIDRALEDRGKREAARAIGLRQSRADQLHQQEMAAAGGLLVSGHPGAAAAVAAHTPLRRIYETSARAINDRMLAPLQRAAEGGAQWAEISRMALEQGLPQSFARAIFERAIAKPYQPAPSIQAPPTPVAPQEPYRTSTAIYPGGK